MTAERVPLIAVRDVHFSYQIHNEDLPVLRGVSFTVQRGEYVAVIGHNGSGKSTLAKHLNGLLIPTRGDVLIDGMNTREKHLKKEIRKRVGMVFQHPDNQIVATIVEDDVAFGLENIGVPAEEMEQRVHEALTVVGMIEHRQRPPHHLSGGQKQRVAVAGIVAMRPDCIVLDEATSMLDSYGRAEVLSVVDNLHKAGMTVMTITHHMSEVARADRVIVMEAGEIAMEGTPREIFSQRKRLEEMGLDVPDASRIAQWLHEQIPAFRGDLITQDEVIVEVERLGAQRMELTGR